MTGLPWKDYPVSLDLLKVELGGLKGQQVTDLHTESHKDPMARAEILHGNSVNRDKWTLVFQSLKWKPQQAL